MIPSDSYFDSRSGEKYMYDALKLLPDDYYVFHSYRLVQLIPDKGLNENEIDFLIFNPNYGCLFLECKNSKVSRTETGQRKYIKQENGVIKEINMKDPFDQAFSGQHNLFNKLRDTYPEYKEIINKCKFMVAVWFPKYTKEEINNTDFGPNVVKDLIISKEALYNPNETLLQISKLMERMNKIHIVCKYEEMIIEDAPGYKHTLTKNEAMQFYGKVLCPTFKAIVNVKKDYEQTYIELLEEQCVVLDFLRHQKTAAINGASGTGKTLVAIERARRLSDQGEKVLFLCYNKNLKTWLCNNFSEELSNVDFYTLDAFGCKVCKVPLEKLSYHDVRDCILHMISYDKFEYQHIIIDEGQDFGKDDIDEADILELFYEYGESGCEENPTSFFIFYDKNQMVNSRKLPSYIQNVDSKLTLYKNCRNTKNIAKTAYSLIDLKPTMFEKAWNGDTPDFYFYENTDELMLKLGNLTDKLSSEGQNDRVIITLSDSIYKSDLLKNNNSNYTNNIIKINNKKTRIFTCPTFKGLESENIIIVDINDSTFDIANKSFYVAASRAKKHLYIFINKNNVDIDKIISSRFSDSFFNKNREKRLVGAMHGFLK